MTYFLMYLLTIVDNIPIVLTPIVVLLGFGVLVGTIGMVIFSVDECEEVVKAILPWYKRGLCAFILLTSLILFIPSSKGIAFIYVAPQIIENGAVKDTVKNIPELTKLGTEYLKEILADKIQETK